METTVSTSSSHVSRVRDAVVSAGMLPPAVPSPVSLPCATGTSTVMSYGRSEVIFAQGESAASVLCVQSGGVRLSVLSATGKEAVVALLGPGDFFGEGCLAGQRTRMSTATAIAPSTVLVIDQQEMFRMLRERPDVSGRFLTHVLTRKIRVEEDLVDQLTNSSEKRLARILLRLARHASDDVALTPIPKLSQEVLAEMVGTTRSRVNLFMNKFRRLGFIAYDGDGITIRRSLLTVVRGD